jgi:hypothetical protein
MYITIDSIQRNWTSPSKSATWLLEETIIAMAGKHPRPTFVMDHERSAPNTPSPFDGYMQHLGLMYPAEIVTLPDGLSIRHIHHPIPEWLDAYPNGRSPTPDWAKTSSISALEPPHQSVPVHLAFQRPDLWSNHQLQSHSRSKGGTAAPYDVHFLDGHRVKTVGADVPPWYGPEFRSVKKGSVEAPVVPPFHSPGFSSPGFEVPTIPPFYTPKYSTPIGGSAVSISSSPGLPFGLPTSPIESPFIPPPLSDHDETRHRDDSGRRPTRHVHIRSPPVSQTWIPELPSSTVSTASTSSAGTVRGSQDSRAHISDLASSASTGIAPPTVNDSDHRNRDRSLLQRPRRSVSNLRSKNPTTPSPARPPRKKAVCVRSPSLL